VSQNAEAKKPILALVPPLPDEPAIKEQLAESGSGGDEVDLATQAAPVTPSTAGEQDLLQYRVREDYDGQTALASAEVTEVRILKPKMQWHCIAHPDPAYSGRFYVFESEQTKQFYLIIGDAAQDENVKQVSKLMDLFPLCTTTRGMFIWPVSAPGPGCGMVAEFNDTVQEIIAIARNKVVSIGWNQGRYVCRPVQHADAIDFRELVPAFFEISWNTMLNRAFKERVIADPQHPVLQAVYNARVAKEIGTRSITWR
jgi:hypothetical protein